MICRLKRILNWDLIEDEGLFNKERGSEIIRDLMVHFNRWKSLIGTSNNLADFVGLQHLVIYTMAKLCFYYWIRDSEIVAEILRQVYICDGHFSSMFAHIMNHNERRSMWPAPNQETRQKEYLTMVYFLTHAHNAKLEFSGVRFVDLRLRVPLRVPPVFLAAIYNKPQMLLLLLRHGAIVDRRHTGGRSDDWDLNMLLRHLIRILWASLGSETEDSSWDTTIIPMGELEFSLMNFDSGGLMTTSNSHDFIRSVSERGIVPRLMNRYLEPSDLRHLCRFTIRDSLNVNWNLPFGVFSLPLPKVLQKYVNLSED
ncbi:Ankyrin repeat and SOCS box protein 17 like protein [Argiope bruennichi]|uniref:Ankyrin repeat and SOCS box protein 17 like protein n=1 Tax=Argiope bruennichi TaxID=94029 RepID=A0A8T0E2K2_ARGBR|nr:Ankyrin repeat and SOCS box protein 17 like protein [Argiope bruennichi]